MSTTKAERKAQARAERLAREQAAAAAAARKRRLTITGGVLLVAVIAVAIAIAVSSGSSSSSTASSAQAKSAVNKLLAGIPQSGTTLGKANAPVQVTVFEDLQCPVCKEFTLSSENRLIANDVRSGRVKLVFRSLQTATPDSQTFQAQQQAAMAAAKQNKLWHYVELFYHQQGQEGTPYVTEAYLDKLARAVPGLDYKAWLAARNSGTLANAVSADQSLAQAKGFNATPTIVVHGPKASPTPVSGAVSYAELEQLVKQAGG